MAKKRHARRAPEARTLSAPAAPRAPAPPPPPPKPTSWWFDFDIERHHLALLRFLFFGVLAVDAFLAISVAPRYGAGAFNVPQLTWLPLPSLDRELMLGLDVLLAYLFVMAALGVGTRHVVAAAAALDAYGYFSSQLDSYQHHYLVVMLLICASFVPWEDPSPRVKSWALRLFTVQVAILYGWAAVAKLDDQWLDGTALARQLSASWVSDMFDSISPATMAKGVFFGEVALAIGWLWRRSWPWLLPLGLAFHVGVELAGFRIGLFSYVMIAIYVLMVPERIAAAPGQAVREIAARWPRGGALAYAAMAIALVASLIAWWRIPLPLGVWVLVLATTVGLVAFVRRRTWAVGAAHLAAWALIAALAFGTDEALDYHKFWAGSSRRLGQTEEMRRAYLGLVEIAPDHGPANYYLGKLAITDGKPDVALARFRRAQRAQPEAARGWVGEAEAHRALGDLDAAKAAVAYARKLDPTDVDASRLALELQ